MGKTMTPKVSLRTYTEKQNKQNNCTVCVHSPSPSLALLVGNRDVIGLVKNFQQVPRGEMKKGVDKVETDVLSSATPKTQKYSHASPLIYISAVCLTFISSTQSTHLPAVRTTKTASFCWNPYLLLQDPPKSACRSPCVCTNGKREMIMWHLNNTAHPMFVVMNF